MKMACANRTKCTGLTDESPPFLKSSIDSIAIMIEEMTVITKKQMMVIRVIMNHLPPNLVVLISQELAPVRPVIVEEGVVDKALMVVWFASTSEAKI